MNNSQKPVTRRPIWVRWWVSVLLAIAAYCGLNYLVPELCPANSPLFNLCQAAPTFAPLAAMPFLLLAAKQLYDSDLPKEETDNTENDHSDV